MKLEFFDIYDCTCLICEKDFYSRSKRRRICKLCVRNNLHNAEDIVETYFIHYVHDDMKLELLYERLDAEGKILMADYLNELIKNNNIDWDWKLLGYDGDYDGDIWN